MPRGDRTGPAGLGPRTGRAAGFCAGYQVAGFMNPAGGRGGFGIGRGGGGGFGIGRGGGGGFGIGRGGRGWRNQFYATGLPGWARGAYGAPAPPIPAITTDQELVGLKQQAQQLQDILTGISSRIEQFENESSSES